MTAASHGLVEKIGEDLASMFGGDQASASVDAYFRSLRSVWLMVRSLPLPN
jgi:hypothetical protein